MAKMERIFRKKFTLPFVELEQDKTESFILEGEIGALFVRVPDFASTVTAIVSILDADGYEIVLSSALAKDADHRVAAEWPLPGVQSIKVHLSAALDEDDLGDVIVVAYGRELG